MKKTKKERRRRGRSLPRSRAQSRAQSRARLGGVGVRACGVKSKEMRVSVREMSLSVCLCVYEMRDILVKALANGNNQKRAAARFHLWTSEVHK